MFGDSTGTAHDCLRYEERPSTPPEIHKFRKTANLEPGKRYQNPAQVADFEKLGLESRAYGRRTINSPSDKLGVQELISYSGPKSTVQRLNIIKGEMASKSQHPLGKSLPLGTIPPGYVERTFYMDSKYSIFTSYIF